MPRLLYPYLTAKALISLGRRQWDQSDVAPIAYGLAIVFLRLFSLHRYV